MLCAIVVYDGDNIDGYMMRDVFLITFPFSRRSCTLKQ